MQSGCEFSYLFEVGSTEMGTSVQIRLRKPPHFTLRHLAFVCSVCISVSCVVKIFLQYGGTGGKCLGLEPSVSLLAGKHSTVLCRLVLPSSSLLSHSASYQELGNPERDRCI